MTVGSVLWGNPTAGSGSPAGVAGSRDPAPKPTLQMDLIIYATIVGALCKYGRLCLPCAFSLFSLGDDLCGLRLLVASISQV
jgi:hypothetical protein